MSRRGGGPGSGRPTGSLRRDHRRGPV